MHHATGSYIYKCKELEIGSCLKNDITHFLGSDICVVLDVGANVGQSAIQYSQWFLKAQIYSFEPFEDTYQMLQANTLDYHDIVPRNIALSSINGNLRANKSKVLVDSINSLRTSVFESDDDTENIFCTQLNTWLGNEGIKHVDFMKVDVEGYELQVISGAEQSFREGKISVALFEAGIGSSNTWNTPLHKIIDDMNVYGYELIGLYDTSLVQLKNKCHYTNALLASPSLIDGLPPVATEITAKSWPFQTK